MQLHRVGATHRVRPANTAYSSSSSLDTIVQACRMIHFKGLHATRLQQRQTRAARGGRTQQSASEGGVL